MHKKDIVNAVKWCKCLSIDLICMCYLCKELKEILVNFTISGLEELRHEVEGLQLAIWLKKRLGFFYKVLWGSLGIRCLDEVLRMLCERYLKERLYFGVWEGLCMRGLRGFSRGLFRKVANELENFCFSYIETLWIDSWIDSRDNFSGVNWFMYEIKTQSLSGNRFSYECVYGYFWNWFKWSKGPLWIDFWIESIL